MAEVWLATDQLLSRQVAVKLLKPTLAADPVIAERFRREAIAVAQLTHPNVVAVYDTVDEAGRQAVVMQYVPGRSLRQVLDDDRKLSPERTIQIGAAVAAALGAAHDAGLVHRDVKPGNILITPEGRVLLTDFGIAKAVSGDGDLTSDNVMMGTAKYLSPEQVRGRRLDGRADLYSLGLVLYECLAGRVPFTADTDAATALARLQRDPTPLLRLRPTLPAGLVELIHRLLSRNPDDRPASSTAVQATLERILTTASDETGALPPPAPPTPATSPTPATRREPSGPSGPSTRPEASPGAARSGPSTQNSRPTSPSTPPPSASPVTRSAAVAAALGAMAPSDSSAPTGGTPKGLTSAGNAPRRAEATPDAPPLRPPQPSSGRPGSGSPPPGRGPVDPLQAGSRPSTATPSRGNPRTPDATPSTRGAAGTGRSGRPSTPARGITPVGGSGDRRPTPPTARPPRPRDPTPPSSSLHGRPARQFQQRWAPSLVIVGGLLVLALVIGGILWSTVGSDDPQPTAAVSTIAIGDIPTVAPTVPVPDDGIPAHIDAGAVTVLDPKGDPGENDEALPKVFDGSDGEAWYTTCYDDQYRGALEGLGLVLPLSKPATGSLAITFPSKNWAVTIYAADTAATDLAGWGTKVGASYSDGKEASHDFTLSAPHKYVLVWMTQLARDGSGCTGAHPYRGGISEIVFTPAAP